MYYVDNNGNDLAWHGFYGNRENPSGMPYITCPLHTQEAWEEMGGEDGIFDDDWNGIIEIDPDDNGRPENPGNPGNTGDSDWN